MLRKPCLWKLLRELCVREINNLVSMETFFQSDYVFLNKLVYTRLLTFNARRGGEPGTLTLNWLDYSWKWPMIEKGRSWTFGRPSRKDRTVKIMLHRGKKEKERLFFAFLFILDFFYIIFSIHRTAGEGGGHFQFLITH